MIEIIETNMNGRHTILATVATFAEAKNAVNEMNPAFMEDDSDHHDCADAYMRDGRVLAIQPVGFKVTY